MTARFAEQPFELHFTRDNGEVDEAIDELVEFVWTELSGFACPGRQLGESGPRVLVGRDERIDVHQAPTVVLGWLT